MLFNNATSNLERQGIASGFDFLNNRAGFDIIMHLIDYSESSTYFDALIVGLLNTLFLSVLGIFFATILGFIIGIARLSSNWLVAKIASFYIEVFRNVPLLLQIFFWYFAVLRNLPSPRNSISLFDNIFINIRGIYFPEPLWSSLSWISIIILVGVIAYIILQIRQYKKTSEIAWFKIFFSILIIIFAFIFLSDWKPPRLSGFNFRGGLVVIPELMAMLVALSIYTAAFIAEIVRAGINSVGKGQIEAAKSLGLPKSKVMNLIVIPQALRVIIPPLTSQYLNLMKNSSLAAAIAYPDLVSVFAGTTLNQTGQAIEVIGITMSIYLGISLTISLFMNWYNKRIMFKTK